MHVNQGIERMAHHYSILDFFRQMPNALIARINPTGCVKGTS